jgi:chromosome segregation ATPase
LAHRADVSERTISRAKVAHEAGLGGAVIAGEMTLRQAEEAVKAQRAPTIREQKAGTTHEGAGELAARTDAVATKPPLRQRADEDSSSRLPTPLETAIADRDEARDHAGDLADELRIAKSELDAYRAAEIGEGEKHLIAANKRVLKLEDEVRYLTARRDALMDENAQLKREIKSLSRRLGIKANG